MSKEVKKGKVLVLDGETRTALAVVRALHDENIEIAVATDTYYSLAGFSCYTDISFISPDNTSYPQEYRDWLHSIINQWKPDLVIPNSDATLQIIYEDYQNFKNKKSLVLVDHKIFEDTVNKFSLIQKASKLGIKVPSTQLISNQHVNQINFDQLQYPVVLKPTQTAKLLTDKIKKLTTIYLTSREQILTYLAEHENSDFLLQELIIGEAIGFFALCKDGMPIVTFAHQRILEKPPSGGVSVLCKSIPLEETPHEKSLELLKHLKWNGPAMVEYKKNAAGDFYLMEINTRFWGSLQLATYSGVNFPKYLIKEFTHLPIKENLLAQSYKTGVMLRWTLGCLDHLFIKLKFDPTQTLKDIFYNNILRINIRNKNIHQEIFNLQDPKPFFWEIYIYFKKIFAK